MWILVSRFAVHFAPFLFNQLAVPWHTQKWTRYICEKAYANKVEGIRAVVCSEPYTAKLSRQHNNTNILAFGARVIGIETAKMIVDEWLNAEFMGGKHERRVNMLMDIEKRKIHGDK